MSRLKELRLHGFKTFADPTRFVFEPGVNAVIGPNGSGKSNMADAVRWVLGEQSNRSLRTRRADDVIFAGSESRRPQGMAEAILTLDNADGWLPIEFSEVAIGRRAYRSGETEYLINGAKARLRDVVELLAAGRLGANELVVVGQGTVDAALSLRPEERRQLFEEAAGVKNLQVRKNEALARLAGATLNLTRVSDLVGELRPQVRRLALQAQHQQEHDALGRRAHGLVSESHRRREAAARSSLGDTRRRAAAAELALDGLRAEETAEGEAVSAAEERYWAAEAAARQAASDHQAAREARIRREAQVEGLAARLDEMRTALSWATEELAAAEAALTPAQEHDGSDPLAAAAEAEEAWQVSIAQLAGADADLLAAEEALAALRHRESQQIAGEARRGELLARSRARVERIAGELGTAEQAAAAAERDLAPALGTQREAQAAASDLRGQWKASGDALARAEALAVSARQRAADLAARAGTLRAGLHALHERAEMGGRLGSTLAAAGWQSLLDAVDPPEEAWPAIEAVVGGELEQALLWHDGELIARLAEARGAARLLAAGTDADGAVGRTEALAAVGATRTLAEWVGDSASPLAFHRTVVAPDLAALLGGWRQLPAGWCAVTAHGDMGDGRGMVAVRGRANPPGGEAARLHARRRDVAESLRQLELEQGEAADNAARTLAGLAEARRVAEDLEAAVTTAQRAVSQADATVELIDRSLGRARRDMTEMAAELSTARAEEATAGAADPAGVKAAGELERQAVAARDAHVRRGAAASARDAARSAWVAARNAADGIESGAARVRGDRSRLEETIRQLRTSLPQQSATLSAMEADEASALALLRAERDADEQAGGAKAAADATREQLRAELLAIERTRSSAGSRRAELERSAQAAAIDVSRAEEALAALGREREMALESLPVGLPAEPSEETAGALSAELSALDDGALETELRRVRRTLAQVGSVNPFAVEEHAELSARLDALTSQDTDLTAAIASAQQLIVRLETDIAGRFDAAFAAIGAKFDEFCRLLFAGGSASLQMAEAQDSDSSAGIEIVVQPPGKRPQRLAMLSGGERALTGVALLFAMLSVNPVPFCILDEVDAALDEANIGRFADALRVLSKETDFVVVTHNRATIEVADTIYGVTMTDAAVSRVLSLRLADLPVEALIG
jgi:chromosome segregation protein